MISLFGCAANDNKLYELDNPALLDDSGEDIEAYYVVAPADFGTAVAVADLRRINQMANLAGPCTVLVTPIVDGAEIPGQAQTFVLDPADGPSQLLEAHVQRNGGEFQMRVDVVALGGPLAFGAASLWGIPRRSTVT